MPAANKCSAQAFVVSYSSPPTDNSQTPYTSGKCGKVPRPQSRRPQPLRPSPICRSPHRLQNQLALEIYFGNNNRLGHVPFHFLEIKPRTVAATLQRRVDTFHCRLTIPLVCRRTQHSGNQQEQLGCAQSLERTAQHHMQ